MYHSLSIYLLKNIIISLKFWHMNKAAIHNLCGSFCMNVTFHFTWVNTKQWDCWFIWYKYDSFITEKQIISTTGPDRAFNCKIGFFAHCMATHLSLFWLSSANDHFLFYCSLVVLCGVDSSTDLINNLPIQYASSFGSLHLNQERSLIGLT